MLRWLLIIYAWSAHSTVWVVLRGRKSITASLTSKGLSLSDKTPSSWVLSCKRSLKFFSIRTILGSVQIIDINWDSILFSSLNMTFTWSDYASGWSEISSVSRWLWISIVVSWNTWRSILLSRGGPNITRTRRSLMLISHSNIALMSWCIFRITTTSA